MDILPSAWVLKLGGSRHGPGRLEEGGEWVQENKEGSERGGERVREKLRQKVTKTDRHREQQARGGLEGSRYGERKHRGSGEHTSNSPLSSPTLYRCVGLKQLISPCWRRLEGLRCKTLIINCGH